MDEKIKMNALELNKKIADLKCVFQDLVPQEIYINWAENISDAWELFEEMLKAGAYSISKWPDDNYRVCQPSVDDVDFILSSEPTAMLAICKAWLQWNENNRI